MWISPATKVLGLQKRKPSICAKLGLSTIKSGGTKERERTMCVTPPVRHTTECQIPTKPTILYDECGG